jgi:hypothetical protein
MVLPAARQSFAQQTMKGDHLQGNPSCLYCRLATGFKHAQCLDHSVPGFGCYGPNACEGSMGRSFGIQMVILAALTAIVPVRGCYFQHFHTGFLHVSQEPRTIGSRCLNSDPFHIPKGLHPGQHESVALQGCRENLASKDLVTAVYYSGDMQILMGIHATADGLGFCFGHWSLHQTDDSFTNTDAWTRQQRDIRQALLGSHAPARQSLSAEHPEDRQVRGKTRQVDLCVGQAITVTLRYQSSYTVHRCEGQTIQEHWLPHTCCLYDAPKALLHAYVGSAVESLA